MTTQEEQELRAFQAELVASETSLWQPRCVAQAFRRADDPFVFRMQTWIDLDAVESPFLLGLLPEAEEAIAHFEAAFAAFGYDVTTPEACEPDDLIALGHRMIRTIRAGFAMRLRLAPPEGREAIQGESGLGNWLPILACLKVQLKFSLPDALRLPVAQGFALLAAHRCNEGWDIAGETYASLDVPEESQISNLKSQIPHA